MEKAQIAIAVISAAPPGLKLYGAAIIWAIIVVIALVIVYYTSKVSGEISAIGQDTVGLFQAKNWKCPNDGKNYTQHGALCYEDCPPGYSRSPAHWEHCVQNCPEGTYTTAGLCMKTPKWIGVGAARATCHPDETRVGALCYRCMYTINGKCASLCPPGWRHEAGGLRCFVNCPANMHSNSGSCTRDWKYSPSKPLHYNPPA